MPNLQRMVGHAGQQVATGFGTARIAGGGGDIARVASKQRGTAGNKLQPDVGKIRTGVSSEMARALNFRMPYTIARTPC
jgi:hypothetical protein